MSARYDVEPCGTNRYAGRCVRCGGSVAAGEGELFEPTYDLCEKWHENALRKPLLVQHRACGERYGGTTTHWIYDPDLIG